MLKHFVCFMITLTYCLLFAEAQGQTTASRQHVAGEHQSTQNAAVSETKQTAAKTPSTTVDLLAKACVGKKTGDTVRVGQKNMLCPPRVGVRDSGTRADIKYIEALTAACKGRKINETVRVGGTPAKCPAGITNSPTAKSIVACNPSSIWAGWSRCCSYRHTSNMGWQMEWCAWTQN